MKLKRIFLFLFVNKKHFLMLFLILILAVISYKVYKKVGNNYTKDLNVSFIKLIFFSDSKVLSARRINFYW